MTPPPNWTPEEITGHENYGHLIKKLGQSIVELSENIRRIRDAYGDRPIPMDTQLFFALEHVVGALDQANILAGAHSTLLARKKE